MGYFQVDANGTYVNEYAWNKVANMLYLESPAGSGQSSGFSTCIQEGAPVDCYWNEWVEQHQHENSLPSMPGWSR